jgi:hypothetical protein
MKKCNLLCAGFALLMMVIGISAQSETPRSSLTAFYKYDRAHSQTFNRTNINARKRWLSPELYSLLINELRRDAAYLRKNPGDKPYFGDGLPFQPLKENCESGKGRRLVVKQEFQKGNRAAATATFAYPKPCSDADPVVYTIGMIKVGGRWVIDDVNYGEDTTLKQRLRRKEY